MEKLNEKTWKPIPMKRLFTKFVRGKVSSASDEPKCENGIPYVGATDRNNGVIDYLEADKAKIQPGNCVTFIRDGQGSVGSSVYRATPCIATVNTSSGYAKWLNQDTGLFVSTSSNQVREKYSFGYKRKETRLLAERVMLPVDDDGNPDWDYMSSFAEQMRGGLLMRYKNYVAGRLSELEYKEIPSLDEVEWKEFKVGDVFKTVTRGSKTYMPTGALMNDANEGRMPRIRVTAQNNGINGYTEAIKDASFRTYENFVSVSFLGSAFYHPYRASLDMKVHCLQFKDVEMNPALGLFVSVMVMHNTTGTNYGNQLSSEDLVSKRVLLPVTPDGKPDYAYMEQYAKNMMLHKYQQYLSYLDAGSDEE